MRTDEVQLTFTANAHRIGLGAYVIYLTISALIPTFVSEFTVWRDCMDCLNLDLVDAIVVYSLYSYQYLCRPGLQQRGNLHT